MSALLLCFLVVLVFKNRSSLSPSQVAVFWNDKISSIGYGQNYPIHITGNDVNVQNFKKVDNSISYLSNTAFVSLNKTAKEISNRQHSFSNPILKVNNDRIIAFDFLGKKAVIGSKSSTIHNIEKNEDILSAAVAINEKYALATTVNGYASKLEVFKEKKDESFYEYCFSECYVTDIAFNKKSNQVAVVGLNSNNGEMVSNLYVFDCKNENPKLKLDFNDSMLFYVKYMDNNHIAVLGDNILSVINIRNGNRKDYNFENRTLTAYDINDKSIALALSLSEDGTASEILTFNKNGDNESSIKTNLKINSISYDYNKIAVTSYGKAYLYKKNGKCIKEADVGKDARAINLCSSREMYVLGFNDIRKIHF